MYWVACVTDLMLAEYILISISIHIVGVVRTGEFEEALSMYEQAYLLHPSDKLKDKINKIKVCVRL